MEADEEDRLRDRTRSIGFDDALVIPLLAAIPPSINPAPRPAAIDRSSSSSSSRPSLPLTSAHNPFTPCPAIPNTELALSCFPNSVASFARFLRS